MDALFAAAQANGKSPAQTALNWLLRQSGVTAPIIGARDMAQLEDNLGAVGWKLSGELLENLNNVSKPGAPYPYS
jgi:aryl-alcohol dehydrogenase-like predicted oxidoreductase